MGSKAVLCASTGNTSASAAAYAARAGITCAVLVPAGQDRDGQARAGGDARREDHPGRRQFRRLPGTGPQAHDRLPDVALVNSVNPIRIEGQKTAAFEIVDALGSAPDVHCAARRQRRQHHRLLAGLHRVSPRRAVDRLPRMLGTQAAGAAPLVLGEPVCEPETIATAIRIGSPASWASAVAAQQRIQRPVPCRHRRGDPGRVPPGGPHRGRVRRTRIGGQHRRPAQVDRRRLGGERVDGRVHRHRQRPERSRHRAEGNARRLADTG